MRKSTSKVTQKSAPKIINFELAIPEADLERLELSGSRALDSGNFRLTYRDTCWMLHQYLINIGASDLVKTIGSELSRTISVVEDGKDSDWETSSYSTVPVYFGSNDELRHFTRILNSLDNLQAYSEDQMSTIGAFLKVCLLFSDSFGAAKFRGSALNSLVVWREHSLKPNDFDIDIEGSLATIKIKKLVGQKDWDVNGFAHGWYSTHIAALRQALLRSRAWADPNTHDDISNPAKTKFLENRALFLSLIDPSFGTGLSWHQSFCNYNSLLAARKYWTQIDPTTKELLYRWESFPQMEAVWHNTYLSGNWGLSKESLLSKKIISTNVLSCPWLPYLSYCKEVKFDFVQARETFNLVCAERGLSKSALIKVIDLLCRVSEPVSLEFSEFYRYAPLIWNGFIEQQNRLNLFFGVDTKSYVKLLELPRGLDSSPLAPAPRSKLNRAPSHSSIEHYEFACRPDSLDGRLARWSEGLLDDFTRRDLGYF